MGSCSVHELRPGTRLIPEPDLPGVLILEVDGVAQSCVDTGDPTHLVFDYVRRIGDALDLHGTPGRPLRVVHVGGAAMTLPRYVAATRPGSPQIVFEPDAELSGLLDTHLPLPPGSGIDVRPLEGATGLGELRSACADALVLDAFAGDRVPAGLTTDTFLADVHRVLRPDGLLVMNLADQGPLGFALRAAAGVRARFADVLLAASPGVLRGRRFGNVLVIGGRERLPVGELSRRAAGATFPYRVVHGADLIALIGAALPFTDDDAAPSPAPPQGFTT